MNFSGAGMPRGALAVVDSSAASYGQERTLWRRSHRCHGACRPPWSEPGI